MHVKSPRRSPLREQNAELRARVAEAEDTLLAVRRGEVDALVVEGAFGPRLFTLQGLDAETNRFRGEILAQISDAVIVSDGEQRVIYLNAAAEQLYGVAASDALGRAVSNLYSIRWRNPEDEAAKESDLRENGEWLGEKEHVTQSGQALCVESRVTMMREIP